MKNEHIASQKYEKRKTIEIVGSGDKIDLNTQTHKQHITMQNTKKVNVRKIEIEIENKRRGLRIKFKVD